VKSRLEAASAFELLEECKTPEELKLVRLERVPSDVLQLTAELQQEISKVRTEHEEAQCEHQRARCESDELRFQAVIDREAAAREIQELDEERNELRLLLDAKNQEVLTASQELEFLRQITSEQSLRTANSIPVRTSQNSRGSDGNLQWQIRHATIVSAVSAYSEDEHDGEPITDGIEVEDGVSVTEQQSELAQAAKPHACDLQGSCDMLRQPQFATSNSSPKDGMKNLPESAHKCCRRADSPPRSMWNMFKTSFSCCARQVNEPQATSGS